MDSKTIGKWLFVAAIVLAIIGKFVDALTADWAVTIILLLAFAGAYLWIEKDHAKGWLIMALALFTFHTALGGLMVIGEYLDMIFGAIGDMFGVAGLALIVKKIVGWFI